MNANSIKDVLDVLTYANYLETMSRGNARAYVLSYNLKKGFLRVGESNPRPQPQKIEVIPLSHTGA